MVKPIVAITAIPPRGMACFDWLTTGLGILQEQGVIELRYEDPAYNRLLRYHPRVLGAVRRLSRPLADMLSPMDYTCLTAQVKIGDKVANFALDMSDGPFSYAMGLLESVDLYFKCQCPIRFEPEGFPLNRHLRIPYHPDVLRLQNKIRPATIARPLSYTTNLRKNLRLLREWESAMNPVKDIRLFASFASDKTVAPRTDRSPLPAPHNYQSENTLLARWGSQIHHPNLKRDRIVALMRGLGKTGVDARIWKSNDPAISGKMLSETEYRQTLGRSMATVNISGLRRSLPFRFMDTFMTGGAMATDTLAIRWYHPFEQGVEIFEIGDLGYELDQEVDWLAVKEKLNELYDWAGQNKDNARAVRDLYQKKWTPEAFAAYVLAQCRQAIEAKA